MSEQQPDTKPFDWEAFKSSLSRDPGWETPSDLAQMSMETFMEEQGVVFDRDSLPYKLWRYGPVVLLDEIERRCAERGYTKLTGEYPRYTVTKSIADFLAELRGEVQG